MAGDGWGWLGMAGDGWGWLGKVGEGRGWRARRSCAPYASAGRRAGRDLGVACKRTRGETAEQEQRDPSQSHRRRLSWRAGCGGPGKPWGGDTHQHGSRHHVEESELSMSRQELRVAAYVDPVSWGKRGGARVRSTARVLHERRARSRARPQSRAPHGCRRLAAGHQKSGRSKRSDVPKLETSL